MSFSRRAQVTSDRASLTSLILALSASAVSVTLEGGSLRTEAGLDVEVVSVIIAWT